MSVVPSNTFRCVCVCVCVCVMFFLRISRCVLWLFAERTPVYKTNCKSYEKSPVIYISRMPSAVWLVHQSTHSSLEKLSSHKSHTQDEVYGKVQIFTSNFPSTYLSEETLQADIKDKGRKAKESCDFL
jgi:hypothetical protein